MEYKKRWILFGILFILLINILSIAALGSGASLGGGINIPFGNQTFSNITTSPVNNMTNATTNQNSSQSNVNQTAKRNTNTQTNSNNSSSTLSNSSVNSNPATQSSTVSSSSTNSNKNTEKSIGNLIKPFVDIQNNKNRSFSSSKNQENDLSQNVPGYKGQDVKMILVINTLCLFFAFVTLRNYNKDLEETS